MKKYNEKPPVATKAAIPSSPRSATPELAK
ncbi:hypothetical protein COLO4_11271 [Corchorus olitorius]|uniref:Uncharacterized protein n=1 Tax=Corchorus olitorius TaxID=93759 RepID=A0A1R3K557_9ROSI|nr:hypothetical protein COLO4_11271 [Corchorus olitorius]